VATAANKGHQYGECQANRGKGSKCAPLLDGPEWRYAQKPCLPQLAIHAEQLPMPGQEFCIRYVTHGCEKKSK